MKSDIMENICQLVNIKQVKANGLGSEYETDYPFNHTRLERFIK